MITLKEMLAEPQTMYDGGMVQHMAEGGEPEIKFQEGQFIEIDGRKFPSLVTAKGTPPKKLYRYASPQEWKEIIKTGELSPSTFYERTHASASPEKGYSEKGSILLEIEYSSEDAWYSKIGGGDKVYGVTQKKIPVSRITNIGEPESNLPVPTKEESLVGDIVEYAGKAGRKVGKKAVDIATKRVPGVGLISSSPAGEGSARYTPEEMGMKLSAQRGIGEVEEPIEINAEYIRNLDLYHGTTATELVGGKFEASKEGVLGQAVYATPDTEYAGGRAEEEEEGGNIHPVKVNIENPLIVRIKGRFHEYTPARVFEELGVSPEKAYEMAELNEEKFGGDYTTQFKSRATKQGYDSIVLVNDKTNTIQEIAVFNPDQVVSKFKPMYDGGLV